MGFRREWEKSERERSPMKPYPDQILRSIRYSLETVIIPQLADRWARYEAKTMDKMLEHLELRWHHEAKLLLEDSRDITGLFDRIGPRLSQDDETPSRLLNDLQDAVTAAYDLPERIPSVEELTEHNDSLRGLLVQVIETLDDTTGIDEDSLTDLRDDVGRYLRREIDRDNQLARPTHMSFAPPKPKEGKREAKP